MEEKKYIWAVDISMSNTGLVIFEDDAKEIKSILITSIDTQNGKNHQEKLKILGNKIMEYKYKYPPKCISSEKGFYRFAASTEAIYKCHGLISYLLWDIELFEYAPMTVKKEVVGKGNVKKDEVRNFILENYKDIQFENFDQSDAYSVGICYFKKKRNK